MTEIQNIHPDKAIRIRLIVMNLFQWAVWGAYLTSMGSFLVTIGLASRIGIFYAMQGIVSIFMPALMGIVADKYIPAQKLLGICHGIAGLCMLGVGYFGMTQAGNPSLFGIIFPLYSISVAFYMPTIALSNSAAFTALVRNGYDTVKDFPPIRVFGTVGFICAMLFVNFVKDGNGVAFQYTQNQFFVCGILGLVMLVYSFTLPNCPVNRSAETKSLADALGVRAFTMFKDRNMAVFFIFSMLLGVALQITNGFANPFISHFKDISEYAHAWGAQNANAL
ncbi:MAG: MFS transporter, partial [Bacteroidales bacterium]|nr:MFS transporter [Bacteroidales bacterium]